jgi:FMN phosphatase YigB (HAD superfamily)
LLAELKAEFKEQEQAEELKRQQQQREEQLRKEQQLREEQLRAEQRRQRRREALTQEATEWLKNLNPRSEEGRWFEEFSYSYPSKLEAAIDYLEALRETHR